MISSLSLLIFVTHLNGAELIFITKILTFLVNEKRFIPCKTALLYHLVR